MFSNSSTFTDKKPFHESKISKISFKPLKENPSLITLTVTLPICLDSRIKFNNELGNFIFMEKNEKIILTLLCVDIFPILNDLKENKQMSENLALKGSNYLQKIQFNGIRKGSNQRMGAFSSAAGRKTPKANNKKINFSCASCFL